MLCDRCATKHTCSEYQANGVSEKSYYEWIRKSEKCKEKTTMTREEIIRERKEEARKYLQSPFAKGWLNKMQYTEKISETGEKYLFLAILIGYRKISDRAFNRLVNALYTANFDDNFCMDVWIGGRVNWTMLYSQPFTHVNGHETFFCHGVGKDNYSPEDWENDMAAIKEKKGR